MHREGEINGYLEGMNWNVRKKLVARGKYKIIATVKRGSIQIGN